MPLQVVLLNAGRHILLDRQINTGKKDDYEEAYGDFAARWIDAFHMSSNH